MFRLRSSVAAGLIAVITISAFVPGLCALEHALFEPPWILLPDSALAPVDSGTSANGESSPSSEQAVGSSFWVNRSGCGWHDSETLEGQLRLGVGLRGDRKTSKGGAPNADTPTRTTTIAIATTTTTAPATTGIPAGLLDRTG
jgi:hypothetical protein